MTVPSAGSLFRQPDLARTLRALVEAEQQNLPRGRKEAIYAARDRFYRGDIAQRFAGPFRSRRHPDRSDLARYRGHVERPARGRFTTSHGAFEVFKTGFWGQGPVLLQALALLRGLRPRADGPQLPGVHPHRHRGAQAGACGRDSSMATRSSRKSLRAVSCPTHSRRAPNPHRPLAAGPPRCRRSLGVRAGGHADRRRIAWRHCSTRRAPRAYHRTPPR